MQAIETGRHEYRMKGWMKGLYVVLGLMMGGMGIVFAGVLTQQPKAGAGALAGLFPLAIGIYFLALALRSRLVIAGTHVEVRGAIQEKSAEMSDVEGFRTITTRNGSFWRLQLKQGRGSITIQKWFDCDELRWWLQQLTDLDERGRAELLNEIEQNQELGATPEDRLDALKRARTWNIALMVIAAMGALGLIAGGAKWRFPAAAVLALVPVAALFLLNSEPLLFAVGTPRRDPRADVSMSLLICAMGLVFGSMQMHFVSIMPLLPFAGGAALVFIAAFYMLGHTGAHTPGFHVVVLMYGAFFSFGLITAGDTLLDHGTPTPYAAQVENKHESSGRSTTYYLDFDAWGPFSGANSVSVPYSVYQTAEAGDTFCFEVYPGALRAAWFKRVACDGPREIQTTP